MIGCNGHTYILSVDRNRDKIDINICYLLISHNSFCQTNIDKKKYPVLYPELNNHEHVTYYLIHISYSLRIRYIISFILHFDIQTRPIFLYLGIHIRNETHQVK